MVTAKQFAAAVREFKRTNKPVLIARNVNIYEWQTSGINERMGNVFVDDEFEDDILKSSIICDLWIVKCQGPHHAGAAGGIARQLEAYCAQFEYTLAVGGGDMNLKGCTRRADTVVRLRSDLLNGQSDIPYIMLAVGDLLRFYPKRRDSTFAAVATLYRRWAGGVVIEDAVSFGSANIDPSTIDTIQQN